MVKDKKIKVTYSMSLPYSKLVDSVLSRKESLETKVIGEPGGYKSYSNSKIKKYLCIFNRPLNSQDYDVLNEINSINTHIDRRNNPVRKETLSGNYLANLGYFLGERGAVSTQIQREISPFEGLTYNIDFNLNPLLPAKISGYIPEMMESQYVSLLDVLRVIEKKTGHNFVVKKSNIRD